MTSLLLALALAAPPPAAAPATAVTADLEAAYLETRKPLSLVDTLKLAEKNSHDLAAARAGAAQVAANPAHRLHAPLLEAVAWSSDHHRARPGFHRRVGVAKAAVSGPDAVAIADGADDLDDLDA